MVKGDAKIYGRAYGRSGPVDRIYHIAANVEFDEDKQVELATEDALVINDV